MTSDMVGSYDEMRGRHVAYVGEHMPEYLARLRWSRAAIDAQTRALRELLRHSAHRSRWHRTRLRNVDVDRLTPARLTGIPPIEPPEGRPYPRACFTNVPCSYSRNATRSSACVFITMGPYHAIGSPSGLPLTRRKRTGRSSVETATVSPGP